jgi:CRISPR-associated protein Cmr5
MPETTGIASIERERARFAYKCAYSASLKDLKFAKEYKAYVKKIPMMIKANGLSATFAFVFSKAKDGKPYELIYHQTAEWLKQDQKKLITLSDDKVVEKIIELDSPEYRAITFEILSFFSWLRRFAEGLIKGDDE